MKTGTRIGDCYGGGVALQCALDENQVAYSLHMYPETGHGFHNDTSQVRYNEKAAMLAWKRSVAFFDNYLRT